MPKFISVSYPDSYPESNYPASDKYDEDSQKWAFGVICSIIGFWLR